MTDYDEIRTCCSDAAICSRCWVFIALAVRVLDNAIRTQFGYKHLLWVYSGRRGIHLWISDKEAIELTDDERKAMVGWLTVIAGGKEMHKKVNVRQPNKPLPPSIQYVALNTVSLSSNIPRRAALEPLAETFMDLILDDQDCFDSKEGWQELLHLIPEKSVQNTLREKWSKSERSSQAKWADLRAEVKALTKGSQPRVCDPDPFLLFFES